MELIKTNMGKIGETVKEPTVKTAKAKQTIEQQLNAIPLKYNRAIFRHPENETVTFIADFNKASDTGQVDDKGRKLYTVAGFFTKNGTLGKYYVFRMSEQMAAPADIVTGETESEIVETERGVTVKKKRGRPSKKNEV